MMNTFEQFICSLYFISCLMDLNGLVFTSSIAQDRFSFHETLCCSETLLCDCDVQCVTAVTNGGYNDRDTQKQTQLIFFSTSIDPSNEKKISLT